MSKETKKIQEKLQLIKNLTADFEKEKAATKRHLINPRIPSLEYGDVSPEAKLAFDKFALKYGRKIFQCKAFSGQSNWVRCSPKGKFIDDYCFRIDPKLLDSDEVWLPNSIRKKT